MSNQARTAAGDAAAAAQAQVYASQGHDPCCVSGQARPQGYADPQVKVTDYSGGAFDHGSETGR